jgi:hypothetical protein
MRRLVITSAAAVAALAALPAQAAPGRTVVTGYTGTASVQGVVTGGVVWGGVNGSGPGAVGFVLVPKRPGERSVSVQLADRSGLPVAFMLAQSRSDGAATELGEFCGATRRPVRVATKGDVVVYLELGSCGTTPSTPTAGTARVVFH